MKQSEKEGKPTVWTPFNYREHPEKWLGQVFTLPSQTIPDQTMSMRELLERHTRGMDLGGIAKEGLFEDEENDPQHGINPKTLDLADIEQMKRENAERIKNLQEDKATQERLARDKKEKEKEQKLIFEHEEKKKQNKKGGDKTDE